MTTSSATLYRWLDHTDAAGDLARPDLTDPALLAACGLINATPTAAYFAGDLATVTWLGLEALRICLERGPAPALVTPAAYTAFGAVALRGDYAAGYRAARRTLELGEARGYEPGTSQARAFFALFSCWAEPIENSVHAAQRAREGLVAGGDLANAGYTYYASVPGMLDCAPSLDRLPHRGGSGGGVCAPYWQRAVRPGRSTPTGGWLLYCSAKATAAAGETVSADKYVGNPLAHFFAHLSHANAAAIFGDLTSLVQHTETAMQLLPVAVGLYPTAVARLLRGLALAGQARSADPDKRGGLLAELDEVTRRLAARAADAPGQLPAPAAAGRGRAGLGSRRLPRRRTSL